MTTEPVEPWPDPTDPLPPAPLTPQQRAAELARERRDEHRRAQEQERQSDEHRTRMAAWCASFRSRWRSAFTALAAKLPKQGEPFAPLSVAELDAELRAFGRLLSEKDGQVLADQHHGDPQPGSRPWLDPATGCVNPFALLPSRLEAFGLLRRDFDDPTAVDAALLLLAAYDGGDEAPLSEPADPRAFGWLLTLAHLTAMDPLDEIWPLRLFDPKNPQFPIWGPVLPTRPLVWEGYSSKRDLARAGRILRSWSDSANPDHHLFPSHFAAPGPLEPADFAESPPPAELAPTGNGGPFGERPPSAPGAKPDGPEAGRWLWWQGKRHGVPAGNVYKLIELFWDRESAGYDAIDAALGDPHEPDYLRKLFADAGKVLKKIGIPWKISADSTTRTATKQRYKCATKDSTQK